MASLIEELTLVLEKELELYTSLLPVAEEKTQIIIRNDLQALGVVTDEEQRIVDEILSYDKKRQITVENIKTVLNKQREDLKISDIVAVLDKQPTEQKRLAKVHDALKDVLSQVGKVNEHNRNLIEQSLELIQFDMNYIQSTRMSPGNNNYNKSAVMMADAGRPSVGMFDAKQ